MIGNALHRLKRALRGLAYAALLTKLLVPAGYMPAAVANGSLYRLCHGAPGAALLAGPTERRPFDPHHPHGHHVAGHDFEHWPTGSAPLGGSGDHAWEHCPFGASFSSVPVTPDANSLVDSELSHAIIRPASKPRALAETPAPFDARAPPVVSVRHSRS